MIVKIPSIFAYDHDLDRLLPSGKLISENNWYRIYDANREELEEWLSDAEFYSDRDHWRDQDWFQHEGGRSICRSAERAIPHIKSALEEKEND